MQANTLLTKYRPQSFEECLGNEEVIKALASAVRGSSRPHCYLFTGSSGIGKTTLARIIASEIQATVNEIDAATHSGVDASRQLVENSAFVPITALPNTMHIIDECHSLSRDAWKPLLKITEDTPEYLYFAFCTTEPQKVPDAIKTRSYPIALRPLRNPYIEDLITTVAEIEGWQIDNNVFQGIVQASLGSARRALTILQAGHACASKDELSKIILSVESDENPAIKLAKALLKGVRSWKAISQYLEEIQDEEEAIIAISRYLAAVLVKSEEEQAKEIYRMLRSFTETETWDKKIHFYTGIGKIMWGQLPF